MSSRINAVREACKKPPKDRTEENISEILDFVKDVKFFQKLTNTQQRALCRTMTIEEFHPREFIFQKGDIGDKFYIVLTGSVSVQLQTTACPRSLHVAGSCECPDRPLETVSFLEKGIGFGELALQCAQPRSATIQASEHTETLVTTRLNYEMYAGQLHRQFIEERVRFLRSFPQIEEALERCLVSTQDIAAMANCLNERSLGCSEAVVRQGDIAENMIFVRKGQLAIHRVVDWDPKQRGSGASTPASTAAATAPHLNRRKTLATGELDPPAPAAPTAAVNLAKAMLTASRKQRAGKVKELCGEEADAQGQAAGPADETPSATPVMGVRIVEPTPEEEEQDERSSSSAAVPAGGLPAFSKKAAWSTLKSSMNAAALLKKVVDTGFAAAPQGKMTELTQESATANIEHFTEVSAARRKVAQYQFRQLKQERRAARETASLGRRQQPGTPDPPKVEAADASLGGDRRVLRIGVIRANQYFGDRQVCSGEPYPVSLVADPVAEIYLMSKHDILRRLPKKLFALLFAPDIEAVPNDAQLIEMCRATERWSSFCRGLHGGDTSSRRYESTGLPPAAKSRVNLKANLDFLGVAPARAPPDALRPPRNRAVMLTPKDTEVFSQCPASFLRKFDKLKRDPGLLTALSSEGVQKTLFRGLSGPEREHDAKDFRFTQTWAKCAKFPVFDLDDDGVPEEEQKSSAAAADARPAAESPDPTASGPPQRLGQALQRLGQVAKTPSQGSAAAAKTGSGPTGRRASRASQTPTETPSVPEQAGEGGTAQAAAPAATPAAAAAAESRLRKTVGFAGS